MKLVDMLELTFLNGQTTMTIEQMAKKEELIAVIENCTDIIVREALDRRYNIDDYRTIPTWYQVAFELNTTEDVLKHCCGRYLASL